MGTIALDRWEQMMWNEFRPSSDMDMVYNNMAGDDTFPLTVGSVGNNVAGLQQAINYLGVKTPVDGNLTQKTVDDLLKAGFSLPDTQDSYQQIIDSATAKANPNDPATLAEKAMAAIKSGVGATPKAGATGMSTTEKVIIGVVVIGGLIGLGFAIHTVTKNKSVQVITE